MRKSAKTVPGRAGSAGMGGKMKGSAFLLDLVNCPIVLSNRYDDFISTFLNLIKTGNGNIMVYFLEI